MLGRDNPMMRALVMTLSFEVVVYLLAVAVMIMVEGVRPAVAGGLAGAAAGLALVAAATLRRSAGRPRSPASPWVSWRRSCSSSPASSPSCGSPGTCWVAGSRRAVIAPDREVIVTPVR